MHTRIIIYSGTYYTGTSPEHQAIPTGGAEGQHHPPDTGTSEQETGHDENKSILVPLPLTNTLERTRRAADKGKPILKYCIYRI